MAFNIYQTDPTIVAATGVAPDSVSVTKLNNGGWVVVWQSDELGTDDIFMKVYGPSGAVVLDKTLVTPDLGNPAAGAAGSQSMPSVAARPNGGFVVVWQSDQTGGGDVCQSVYQNDGTLWQLQSGYIANQTVVASSTTGYVAENAQTSPSVAAFSDGHWIVTMASVDGTSNVDLVQQIYSTSGPSFTPSTVIASDTPAISAVTPINFDAWVVVWRDQITGDLRQDVFVGAFPSAPNLVPSPDNDLIAEDVAAVKPEVVPLGNNKYVVIWEAGGDVHQALFQYTPNGLQGGTSSKLAGGTVAGAGTEGHPTVAKLAGGGYVVAWESVQPGAPDGTDIYYQIYSANGTAVGGPVLAAGGAGDQLRPKAIDLPGGGFLLAWVDSNGQILEKTFAQLTAGADTALDVTGGSTLPVNSGTLSAGDVIQGVAGTGSTLQLAGSGTFDLTKPATLAGFDSLVGSSITAEAPQTVLLNAERLSQFSSLDGGAGLGDTLSLKGGGVFELSNKFIKGFEFFKLLDGGSVKGTFDQLIAMELLGPAGSAVALVADPNTTAVEVQALRDHGYATVNAAPNLQGASLSVSEGEAVVLGAGDFQVGDADGNTAFTFTVSDVKGGTFQVYANGAWQDATSFTSAQLSASQVRFVHDGGEAAPSFWVAASDGVFTTGTKPAAISFTRVNDAPTGEVTILDHESAPLGGSPLQGELLTADIATLEDAEGYDPATVTYQWYRDDGTGPVAIAGATADTYATVQADVGRTITVRASYVDGRGTAESVTSVATGPVANVNDAPTGLTIEGPAAPKQGDTLTASGFVDPDGYAAGDVAYVWRADGKVVGFGETYTLKQADVGKKIAVSVLYTDSSGVDESMTSPRTAPVLEGNGAPTGLAIQGTAKQGETLVATGLADDDGLPAAVTYTWKADGEVLQTGTGASFTLTQAAVGKTVTVTAAYTDLEGHEETITSGASGAVANVNDAPTGVAPGAVAVAENMETGKEVATLAGLDPDGPGGLTLALVDGAGAFALAGNKLVVSNALALDFEAGATKTVKVSVSDGIASPMTQEITITLTDVTGETVTGDALANTIRGGLGADTLKGMAGNDTLIGGADNDILFGGLGADTLTGGTGRDAFVFDTQAAKTAIDKITDFSVPDDSLFFDNAVFTKLGKGGTVDAPLKLNAAFFKVGTKALDANDYLIYNPATGALYYDPDGTGRTAQVQVATLAKNLKLTAADFFVV